ncbi:hypothetical protein BT93_L4682 [Corymbia citriodora subsp. variegata]|uniref:Uncharacterized protein n=1 Tax=Corymbia citriodora subsp. variegata TaxID=360336 RepID=A0A8T0CXW5_CORYI|nr:hypothetical protein BT93_L4682 [Corymbia citriodora subsp. variegata]
MNRRTRRLSRRSEPYLKYLKPGALAQLRDSRISARLHRVDSLLLQIRRPPPPPPDQEGRPLAAAAADGPPCFVGRIYGPRCLQRKKLVAAECVWFVGSGPGSPARSEPDPAADFFGGGDGVAAH